MTPAQARNLQRLLNPRHIAIIGGNDAAYSAAQCAKLFNGNVWGVNPKRPTLGGVPCFNSVDELPQAPDAVFLATPKTATLETIKSLSQIGAGGVTCFTAGYGELGNEGQIEESQLIHAAGDMALVGPNCYGMINYTNGSILWPFGAGETRCQKGIALIMQSGMLPANITMNDRSLPVTHVISAGNQASLTIEDYIDVLVDDDRVTAIGLYIEGIKNISKFGTAALKALKANKPVVVLKAGKSNIAAQLTVSHTGSMAGTDSAFQALFEKTGIIRVFSPVELVETLKFVSISGAPVGNKIAAFTCSGGDAAMVADVCESLGLDLKTPSIPAKTKLIDLLPPIATVSNPLDYTTPIWGNTKLMPQVFQTLIEDNFDTAVVIQDFPPPHIHDDNQLYRNDAQSFCTAIQQVGIPGAVCSDLPENFDIGSRALVIDSGVSPLQGLDSGLKAISNGCQFGVRRQQIMKSNSDFTFSTIQTKPSSTNAATLDEYQSKSRLHEYGVEIPYHLLLTEHSALEEVRLLKFPIVLKAVSAQLPHKSEAGAVVVNIQTAEDVFEAVDSIKSSLANYDDSIKPTHYLAESMVKDSLTELLVGIRFDAQFGQTLTLASGGILVELIADATTVLLPCSDEEITKALKKLKCFRLMTGFRGKPTANLNKVIQSIRSMIRLANDEKDSLLELEVNPFMVTENSCIAVDAMISQSTRNQIRSN